MLRFAATAVLLLAAVAQSPVAQTSAVPYRAHLIQSLHRLVATGLPVDNEHDDGEWLQRAVTYAIRVGDEEVEHLAIRAAAPLRARITRPVSSTATPSSIEVVSYQVLSLPRPVPYLAFLEVSLDDQPFIELGSQAGAHRTIELHQLGANALRPGTHYVRLRATLVFGDANEPFHRETRDLAPVAYALFDESRGSRADARQFIYSPAAFAASTFDPLLPSQPLLHWLGDALASRGRAADTGLWTSRYCSELTLEHHMPHDGGGICVVVHFDGGGPIGQLWFRTGQVEHSENGATWFPAERPSLEAVFLSDGRAVPRLSALPALLDRAAENGALDTTLAPPDIAITPATPRPGAPVKALITVHNRGEMTVQNLRLQVLHVDGLTDGLMRNFLIDVPALGSESLAFEVTFRHGYGLLVAHPFVHGHGLAPDVITGPPLQAVCSYLPVNPSAAPRDYLSRVGNLSDCQRR